MAQGAARPKELPFGIVALDVRGECLGHGPTRSPGLLMGQCRQNS
jgi:hypothetical protein